MAIEVHRGEPLADQLKRGRDELRGVREEASSIAGELRVLAQKELELAQAEISESVGHTRSAAIFGGLTAIASMLTLVFAALTLMFVLDLVLPMWAAALITMGALAAVTLLAVLLLRAHIKGIRLVPERAIESVNEDVRWARNQLRFNAR
jgi:hypothetical protein